jgi:hypothetical protein
VPAIQRPVETHERFVALFGVRAVSRREALGSGFTRGQLDAAVRRGLLISPRYGVLHAAEHSGVELDVWRDRSAESHRASHLHQVRATLAAVRDEVLVAGDSAALVHDLPRPTSRPPLLVQLVRPDGSGYAGGATQRRGSPIPEEHRTVVDGIPVTSLARTAVEVARGRSLPSALVPLDAAARRLITVDTGATGNDLRALTRVPELRHMSRERLRAALHALKGWAGTVRVRDALTHVDPSSESALESRSRGWFIEAGLGPLNPGTPIPCAGTTYWADFCDIDRGVIGEADGWSKYGETALEVRATLDRERRRAATLEYDGWRIVRWSSTDGRMAVIHRVSRALNRRVA